ncbi:uncharacterized protein [Ambystoma mexicanum]|uniref:uncharacterized protein n=1 Tax=Ambystoma mexicanum TaxID=8296 RepID=UPI0037E822C4
MTPFVLNNKSDLNALGFDVWETTDEKSPQQENEKKHLPKTFEHTPGKVQAHIPQEECTEIRRRREINDIKPNKPSDQALEQNALNSAKKEEIEITIIKSEKQGEEDSECEIDDQVKAKRETWNWLAETLNCKVKSECQKGSRTEVLTLGSWNTQRFCHLYNRQPNKLLDIDIICLQETRVLSKPSAGNYEIAHNLAIKKRKGRPKVGLLTLIKTDRNIKLISSRNPSPYVQVSQITVKPYGDIPPNNLHIINIYWQHRASDESDFLDMICEIIDQINEEEKSTAIILCGHLNMNGLVNDQMTKNKLVRQKK